MTHNLARRRAIRAFAKRLRLRPPGVRGAALLDAALTHDSFANERGMAGASASSSNERLEFLGDAVIGHVVAHALFQRYPDDSEGALSRRRAALVSRDALAGTARRIDVAPLVLLGKGEAATRGEQRPSILAGVMEALVGAVYLGEGFAAAERFVRREHLAHAEEPESADPKTALQEYAQSRFKRPPTYAVTLESGPAHAKTFTISVSVGDRVMGTGTGPTKKQAQAQAAAQALRKLSAQT
ncbi:MAG TPA: ribonuclease III [Candidatus Eremiobacteraceae bacterium]|nr:ribonuclease III [Candidatus Eremiobacteraceae bacterium]